ncbi:MAG TPA: DUF4136 domain-containing protein [Terriglobia bacterium]|nr:DUF4136 domain-containing protein [Terriglobia bacterium]
MRGATVLAGMILCTTLLFADDRHVDFDANVDFTNLKTFAIRESRIISHKPELNNRLFIQRLVETIRAELTAKGLKETADRPDLFVDFSIDGMDYSIVERQAATRIPDGPNGQRGYVVDGTGPYSVLSTEGTLVIDLTTNPSGKAGMLVWRGIYRDEESNGPKLAQKLPGDAKKLLSEYPPKKKSR